MSYKFTQPLDSKIIPTATISGFTMVRNAMKYYFPIVESITSALPLVEEFVVALGEGDDETEAAIRGIDSPKIRIVHRRWSEESFKDGRIFAEETNEALSHCTSDWCLYLQADEVLHEKDYAVIRSACHEYKTNKAVEGLLFKYFHFYGDYAHHLPFHGWYKQEIRMIKNGLGITSYKDAQSFRRDGKKLQVAEIPAHIYHYGWVRPPELMQSKKKEQDGMHHGTAKAEKMHSSRSDIFQYGPLGKVAQFLETHPQVMTERIAAHSWKSSLDYSSGPYPTNRPAMKHERLKYRLLTFLENSLLGGRELGGYSNWTVTVKQGVKK